MSTVLVATVIPIPEHREEVIAAIEEAITAVHSEDGCELYALHEGKDRLVMIEKWATPEAIAGHGGGTPLKSLTAALSGKLAAPLDVQTLTPHPAGTSEQGQL